MNYLDLIFFSMKIFMSKVYHKLELIYYKRESIYYCHRYNVKFTGINYPKLIGRIFWNIEKDTNVSLGSFTIHSGVLYSIDSGGYSKIRVKDGAHLKIGDGGGMTNTVIHCFKEITIGNNVVIGAGTMIFDTNFHSTNWVDRLNNETDQSNIKSKAVHIGNNVFIGTRSIICKGVTIGDYSMISAGSVVVNDIPPQCIAGGNPCKVIKVITIK